MKHNVKKGPNKETLDTFKQITNFSISHIKLMKYMRT